MARKDDLKAVVDIDTTQLDEAIAKVQKLLDALYEVQKLLDTLYEVKKVRYEHEGKHCYNLISSNNCMGKAVVIEGGTGNSAWGNKFDNIDDLP